MKIYTKLRIDASGKVLEEESFEYQGPVAYCKGGSDAPPGPTATEEGLTSTQMKLVDQQVEQLSMQNQMLEELYPSIKKYMANEITLSDLQTQSAKQLLPLQTELAKQGIDLNQLQINTAKSDIERNKELEPVLLETMGYQKDASGKYVAVSGGGDPIQQALQSRFEGALSGKEGMSPELEENLRLQKENLSANLSQRLGTNWQQTTPGIQAMSEFDKKANIAREETRQGLITTTGNQYMNYRQGNISNLLALTGKAGTTTASAPTSIQTGGGSSGLSTSGLFGGTTANSTMSGISGLQSSLYNQRMDPWMVSQGQSAGQNSAMLGGLMGGAGIGGYLAAGTAVGGPVGAVAGAGVGLLAGYLLS